jgi:hypothetical protein
MLDAMGASETYNVARPKLRDAQWKAHAKLSPLEGRAACQLEIAVEMDGPDIRASAPILLGLQKYT